MRRDNMGKAMRSRETGARAGAVSLLSVILVLGG